VADVETPTGLPPFPEAELSAWKARLSASRDVAKELVSDGRKQLERYTAKTLASTPSQHTVVVPLDYASVEQKKAQLFFQVPEVTLEALQPAAEPAAPIMTAVTNHVLGPFGVNSKAMVFEALTDVLCPMGYAVTKIGYENVIDGTNPVQTGQMIPDPSFKSSPGSILGLQAGPMIPEVVQAPNIISETYYWKRLPPGHFACPSDFRGSNFDEASFLAWRFSEDVIGTDTSGSYSSEKDEELLLVPTREATRAKTPKRCGWEVWYKATRFDPDAKHPELVRTFKLYDDEPIERQRRDSPFQRILPDGTVIGMKGYPLHVLTLRYLSDAWHPPSDSQMGGPIADEISIGRSQLLRRRDRSLPQVLYDATRVTPDVMQKLERNDNTGFVGVPGNPQEMFFPLEKGEFGRENYAFNDQGQIDHDRTWALGEQAGVLAGGRQTATKSMQVQRSVDTRLEAERTRVLEWFIAGTMKLMALYQLFADKEDYVRITGPDGETRLQAWNRQAIAGSFLFKARPNSHIRLDAETDFQQELSFFNLAGNAPEGNRLYMLQRLAAKRGLDPARAVVQPPPKTPEPPKGSFTIKMEDFVLPQGPITVEIATQLGLKISPEAILQSQQLLLQSQQIAAAEQAEKDAQKGNPETEHGGAMIGAGKTNPINKHAMDLTGGRGEDESDQQACNGPDGRLGECRRGAVMPLFDVRCTVCGETKADRLVWAGKLPACESCGGATEKLLTVPHMRPDSIPGGLVIENLTSEPVRVESWSERKRLMAKTGSMERIQHRTLPGTDKSKHTSRWTGVPVPEEQRLADWYAHEARLEQS
jgi:hypothetical protein